jgi:hypothetical protein
MTRSQKIYCPVCGNKFLTDFRIKLCCSEECVKELNWIQVLYITGEYYRSNPDKKKNTMMNKIRKIEYDKRTI